MAESVEKQGMFSELLKERFTEFWQQREPRERQYLFVLAVFLLFSVVYGLLLNPAISGIAELKKRIPVVRQQVAEISTLSRRNSQLQAALAEPVPEITKDALESTLNRNGIKAQTISVQDDVVRLQISSAAYASLMECLVELQKINRLTVEEAKLQALPEIGVVSATISLKQQRSGA